MQKLVFINANGVELDLTSDPFGITEWEGFSADDLNIQSQQVPFQDGAVFLDALLGERELAVTVAMNDGNNLAYRYELRRVMISALNPKLGEGVLIYTNDYLSKQIHCIPQLPVFENHNSNDSGTPKVSCTFTACNPYWEDLQDTYKNINFYEKSLINNDGDIKTQLEMEIVPLGDVVKPTIEFPIASKKITYNGTLESGERVLINTNQGKKSATKSNIGYGLLLEGDYLKKAIYSERLGMFFGFTSSNLLKTSYDGVNWETVDYGDFLPFLNIKEVNDNIYVPFRGVGFLKSSDGISWEKTIISETTLYMLNSLAYSPSLQLYVGCGEAEGTGGAILYTSQDGENWTVQNVSEFEQIKDLVWDSQLEKFIGVGAKFRVVSSSDGYNWTVDHLDTQMQYSTAHQIIYSEKRNLLITILTYKLFTSTDGITWTERISTDYKDLNSICMSELKDGFVCAGKEYYYTSQDGISWTSNSVEKNKFYSAVMSYSLGAFIYGVFDNNYTESESVIYHSDNNNIFNLIKNIDKPSTITRAFFINDILLCASRNSIYISKNLKDFEKVILTNDVNLPNNNVIQIIYARNKYILITFNGKVFESNNLYEWNLVYENQKFYSQILYVPEKEIFLIRCTNSVLVSEDLINWEESDRFTNQTTGLTYYERTETFVLSTNNEAKIYTSQDGITWTSNNINQYSTYNVDSGHSAIQYFPAFDLFLWLAGGTSRRILVSKDYMNWQEAYSLQNVYIPFGSLIFSNEYNAFVATCSESSVISFDGYTWQLMETLKADSIVEIYSVLGLKYGENVLIEQAQESSKENVINNLSSDSDLTTGLEIGENLIKLSSQSGMFNINITYRQKYVGV